MSIIETLGQLGIGASINELLAGIPDGAGPPDSLPDVVPDFVGELISTLGGAVGDAKDGLGDVVTEIVAGTVDVIGMSSIVETPTFISNLVI